MTTTTEERISRLEAILPYLATKEDIRGLEVNITKMEVNIAKMETSFVKWMIALIITAAASILSFGMSLTLLVMRLIEN